MQTRLEFFTALVETAVDVVTSFHGVAFLSWIRHPEPTGSRRATPLLLFQHPPGHCGLPCADRVLRQLDAKASEAAPSGLFPFALRQPFPRHGIPCGRPRTR